MTDDALITTLDRLTALESKVERLNQYVFRQTNPNSLTHARRFELREQMAKLRMDGKTVGEVAQSFGVTPETVARACRENKVKPTARKYYRPPIENQERDQAILDAFNAGTAQVDIARAHGLTRSRVQQVLKRMSCQPRRYYLSETQKQKRLEYRRLLAPICDDLKTGLTARQIMSNRGVPYHRITKAVRMFGVKAKRPTKPGNKLTDAQAAEIWEWLRVPHRERGETLSQLSERMGVSISIIGHIKTGWAWNRITGLPTRRASACETKKMPPLLMAGSGAA